MSLSQVSRSGSPCLIQPPCRVVICSRSRAASLGASRCGVTLLAFFFALLGAEPGGREVSPTLSALCTLLSVLWGVPFLVLKPCFLEKLGHWITK